MKIISHRGYWQSADEKNKTSAFRRSFALGYGTETDIRDCCGKLVISHDMPNGDDMELDEFFEIVESYQLKKNLPLALNIKSSGLAAVLASKLTKHAELDYFFFDMATPDIRSFINYNLPVYTRISEYERVPIFENVATGFWLDSFDSLWFDVDYLVWLLQKNKRVCIVSSELHKRDHLTLWNRIKPLANQGNIILCTDFPEEANTFFHGEASHDL
jgi:hypothetical protein